MGCFVNQFEKRCFLIRSIVPIFPHDDDKNWRLVTIFVIKRVLIRKRYSSLTRYFPLTSSLDSFYKKIFMIFDRYMPVSMFASISGDGFKIKSNPTGFISYLKDQ